MKEVGRVTKKLTVSTRVLSDVDISLGEFFSRMEGSCYQEFFREFISKIKTGKQYLFKIERLDNQNPSWYNEANLHFGIIEELFDFVMYELEEDEIVTKPNVVHHKLDWGL